MGVSYFIIYSDTEDDKLDNVLPPVDLHQATDRCNTPSILLFNTRKFYLSKRVLMLNRLTKTINADVSS